MPEPMIPSEEVILTTLATERDGMTARALLERLLETYSREDAVRGIQVAFDRGIVQLSSGARLVAPPAKAQEAA